jgi:hypothetical protein
MGEMVTAVVTDQGGGERKRAEEWRAVVFGE